MRLSDLEALYRRRARRYDITSNLYYLIGLRMSRYRQDAVSALQVGPGDSVLEVACGTGLNFPLILGKIGREGYLEGVDCTKAMLEQARKRVDQNGWKNIKLVQGDAAEYVSDERFDGVLCTFGLSVIPDYKQALTRCVEALKPGGRLVVADVKPASGVSNILNPIALLITKPFGATIRTARRQVWREMESKVKDFSMKEYYLGFIYVAYGIKK